MAYLDLPCSDDVPWVWIDDTDPDNPETHEYYDAQDIPSEEMITYNKVCTLTRDTALLTTHRVTVSVGTVGGSVSPAVNGFSYMDSIPYRVVDNVLLVGNNRFIASATNGYAFKFWSLNGERIYDGDTGVLTTNAAFTASFEEKDLTAKALYMKNPESEAGEDDYYLVFVYDNKSYADTEGVEKVFNINDNDSIPEWLSYGAQSYSRGTNGFVATKLTSRVPKAKTVVFDESFAKYDKLQSTSLWFAADSDGVQPYDDFVSIINGKAERKHNFTNLNTYSLQHVEYMFGGVFVPGSSSSTYANPYNTYSHNLDLLDLSTFDLTPVKNWSYLLANCVGLQGVAFQDDIADAHPQNVAGLFANCENLTDLNLEEERGILNFDKINFTEVTNISYMFYGCSGLETLDLSNFDL